MSACYTEADMLKDVTDICCPDSLPRKSFIVARKRSLKSLADEDITLDKVTRTWDTINQVIEKNFKKWETFVTLPGFFKLSKDTFSLCLEFIQLYRVKHVDKGNKPPNPWFDCVEILPNHLSLETGISKLSIKLILQQIIYCIGKSVLDNRQPTKINFADTGVLEVDHQIVAFRFAKDPTMRPSTVSVGAHPLFFRNPTKSERRIKGPRNQYVLRLAYESENNLMQEEMNLIRNKRLEIRSREHDSAERERRKVNLRRKLLADQKTFHCKQTEERKLLRKEEMAMIKSPGIFIEEKEPYTFSRFTKSKIKRRVCPFPIEEARLAKDAQRQAQQMRQFREELQRQEESKYRIREKERERDILLDLSFNQATQEMGVSEKETLAKKQQKLKNELEQTWIRQKQIRKLKTVLSEINNGVSKTDVDIIEI